MTVAVAFVFDRMGPKYPHVYSEVDSATWAGMTLRDLMPESAGPSAFWQWPGQAVASYSLGC